MIDKVTLSLSVALFQGLLLLYPRSFRRRFGPEMAQIFRDSSRAALLSGGSQQLAILWITTFWDLIATACVERITEVFHMSTSSAGRVAGLLGALGGAIWIVLSLAIIYGGGSGIVPEILGLAAAVMMAIGVVGLFARAGFDSAGSVILAFLFLGYLLMGIGFGLFSLLDIDGTGSAAWATGSMGLLFTLLSVTVLSLYASRRRWHSPWTLILAVVNCLVTLICLPLALGLGGSSGGTNVPIQLLVGFALFASVGVNALVLGLLTVNSEVSSVPPALPAA